MKNRLVGLYEGYGCLLFIVACIFILAMIFGIYCLWGLVFMLLWNWLAVALFGAKALGFWMCVGIVYALHFLGKLIFGRASVKASDD